MLAYKARCRSSPVVVVVSRAIPTRTPATIMAPGKYGDRAKRFFGIDPSESLDYTYDDGSYTEAEPSAKELLLDLLPTTRGILSYLTELFPFLSWIFHYNLTWLLGDVIAGRVPPIPNST